MSYKHDKEYRLTVIGRYQRGLEVFYVGGIGIAACDVDSAELLPDPLPTTPGSVIRTTLRPCTYVRLRDGSRETSTWINEYGMGRSDADMKDWGFTVLFDAGAERA